MLGKTVSTKLVEYAGWAAFSTYLYMDGLHTWLVIYSSDWCIFDLSDMVFSGDGLGSHVRMGYY